ncbi:AMP-binding protein, partial [Streptosporangium sp. NPDC049376]|uniref:AMP-binding protein n=1 Tax=Streptosporangium sp. NPDC049376 TaxID=3366192 RepID=UPI0037B46CE0
MRAREHPDRVAVTEPHGATLTYDQLNTAANRLAHTLNERGVRPGDLVGLHLTHSATYITALLAVLKAGAGYVPLEPGLPPGRLTLMATEPHLAAVITTPAHPWTPTQAPAPDSASAPAPAQAQAPAQVPASASAQASASAPASARVPAPVPVLDLTAEAETIAAQPDTNPGHPADPERVFYIPYTSGSTGRPKGTLVPHRAINGFFTDVHYATWGPDAVTLLHSALSWDGNLVEILPPLLTGGRVVVHTGTNRDPLTVAETVHTHQVTHLFLPTTAFNTIISTSPHLLANVQQLLFGGEAATVRHVRTALTELPATRLANCYGPSECTVFATAHLITPADLDRPTIPIGTPIGDRTVHLIDPDTGQTITEPGQTGEICISGPSLAHGYLNRPALTATHFRPNPGL